MYIYIYILRTYLFYQYYVRNYYVHVYYTHGVFIRQKNRMKLFQKKFLVKSDVKICLASGNLVNCRLGMN